MKNKIIFVWGIIIAIFLFGTLKTTEAAVHDGILNSPATGQEEGIGSTDSNYIGSFKYYNLPSVSYSSGATRKYAVRIISTGTASDGSRRAVQHIYESNAAARFAAANLTRDNSTLSSTKSNWVGILSKNETAISAIGKTNSAITNITGNVFRVGFGSTSNAWNNNAKSNYKTTKASLTLSSNKYYATDSAGEYVTVSTSDLANHPWASNSDRIGVAIYLDEEAPSITFKYDDATNTLTATATDKTTNPVPAAGVSWYNWNSTSATTKVEPVATLTQTKEIQSAGTVRFDAKDDYDNASNKSVTFYEVVFDYNYDEGPEDLVDYKMHNQAISFPEIPTRLYHDFLGWSTDINATSGTKSGTITANENVTYYAIWEKNNSLLSASITLEPLTFVYSGDAKEPLVTVEHGGNILKAGDDYKVTYDNNINVGTASAKIEASEGGDYEGSVTKYFTITPRSITDGSLTLEYTSCTYDGAQKKPNTTLVVSGKTLELGKDYEVSYSNNINTGTATVIVTGIGNYMDDLTTTFTIDPKPIAVEWGKTTFTFNGQEQAPDATASSGVNGESIELKIEGAKINKGNYTATASINAVIGGQANKENYVLTDTETDFTIISTSISDGTLVLNPKEFIYNGGENKPTTILTVDGRTLVNGSEYTVKYTENVNVGTATATLSGIDNYEGTISETFTITKKTVKVIWSNTELVYNKEAQKPIATVDTGIADEILSLDVSGEQINAGIYEATATMNNVSGGNAKTENYELVNDITEFTIAKAKPNLKADDVIIEYNGDEYKIVATQSGDANIQYSDNNSLVNVGSETVTIWVEENENWLAEEITATLTVIKQTVPVTWQNTSLYYTGSPRNPDATAIAKGPGGSEVNVELVVDGARTEIGGPYKATVVSANENYNLEPDETVFYIIQNPNVKFAGELDQTVFTYDALQKRPTETVWATGLPELEGIILTRDVDYTVSYDNNIEPSDKAVVTVTGLGNYEGITTDLYFTIKKLERNSVVNMNNYSYGGTLSTPTITDINEVENITYYYQTVDSNVDGIAWDTVTDAKALPVGTYYMYAVISETEHYKEKLTPTTMFQVLPGNPLEPTVENKTYNGSIQVGVYGGTGLTLSGITEAIDVGTYTAYGTLSENYEWSDGSTGTKEYVWKIYPCNIINAEITLNPTEYMYDGTAHEPEVMVKYNGNTLVEGNDYTVDYKNNTEVGRAEAVITGINNYSGVAIEYFTITPVQLERVVLENYRYYYTGEKIEPKTTVYGKNGKILVENKDYIVEYLDNIEIGTGIVNVIGIGNYIGEIETSFAIQGKDITTATVDLIGLPYVYDGSEKCPDAEVIHDGNTLIEGKDYKITYENNVNAGENTAVAIITGVGEYSGKIKIWFSIMKADREAYILPGKGILLGASDTIPYYYKGEDTEATLVIDDTTIANASDKEYGHEGTIDLTALKVGNSTLKLTLSETQNYRELVLKSEVTVFEILEDAYPIYGSVVINNDDEYTNNPRTMLTLNVDFGDYMYISETKEAPALDNPDWQEFSKKMPHEFDSVEGEKTIYVWFKDKRGNISQMATDSIILDYDATIPPKDNNNLAHDNVLLDQTQIDKTAPDIEFAEYHNKTVDIEVISKQEDVMVNGVRSGIDCTTIKYGYREAGEGMPNDVYHWQDTPIIEGLEYDKDYAFVTQAYDRAGNGSTISEETLIHTELKYETKVTIKDTNRQYNGLIQEIEEATFELANDTPITGTITYTYYVDKDCTTKTDSTRDGSLTEGGAPSKPGVYYVTVELKDDQVYYDVPADGEKPPMAELRIGWYISKTTEDNVFAYPEKTDIDSEEFILNVIGNGEMIDLDTLLATDKADNEVYWVDYKDKIVELKIANDGANQIESIGAEIFNHLVRIEEIVIPNTIVKIGDYAFEGCTNVNQTIIIPTSVTQIGANPFVNVNNTTFETEFAHRVFDTIDGVLVDIDHEKIIAYPNGKVDEKYTITDTIKTIEISAFSGSDNLKDVVIPNGVESIETRAFYDCPNLEVVEVEDLMDKSDNIIELKNIGNEAFSNIKTSSIVYTFSEYIAEKFEDDVTHIATDTDIYYPPVFTLHPIDMNGAVDRQVKFIVDTKPGYPQATHYQWLKVKDETVTAIDGATSKEYITDSLTMDNDQERYYCRAYNAQYYYDRGYVNSEEAVLTMLDNANYIVERGTYNSYLFERLQAAFDFAIDDDVIKPLQNVSNEEKAILSGEKSVILDLESYTISLDETIEIEAKSKLDLRGTSSSEISKTGEYIIENRGSLVLNGSFTLRNTTGFGIKTIDTSSLVITNGNIVVDRNAIYAENAEVTIESEEVNITAITSEAIAAAVLIQKNTKFNMKNGNITISYNTEPTTGNIYGIYLNGEGTETTRISGGNIKAESTNPLGDAIVNAGKTDIVISGTTIITGSRTGITLLDSNLYGDVTVESGTVTGGVYGILNQAQVAKVILGKEGNGVSTLIPEIVGETLAIFNTKEKDTLEFYDGILYSHGTNIVYEDLDNTTLTLAPGRTELIDTATGRGEIITEENYSIFTEKEKDYNGIFYKAAYLIENIYPTLTGPEDQDIKIGEQAVFEVIAEGGKPDVYEYQWQVSTDNGRTWSSVTLGTGSTTSRYTTPIATETMNGYKYRCIVTNARGDVISREAILTISSSGDSLNQRPVGRIIFTNGRVIEEEDNDKVVNMTLIVKTATKLESLKMNDKEIFGLASYRFDDGSIEVIRDSESPIIIEKDGKVVEYTYTYSLKVYENGIITVDMKDDKDRDNTITQTVDLFYDLKVEYYLSNLTETNKYLTVTFYANKPVKPISSIVKSYMNGTYLDLVSLDGGEYSYRFNLDLTDPLPTTIFWFEDEAKNKTSVEVSEIARVRYKQVKFNDGMITIDDLTVIDAYNIAQELEDVIEVNSYEEVQNRYGLNSVQSDMFMSRARDLGAVDILNNATTSKSYDGVFTEKIDPTISTNDVAHEYVGSSENSYVAIAANVQSAEEFINESAKYVDIIIPSKATVLYKGMDISSINLDADILETAPYAYKDSNGNLTNISEDTVATAGFRATIIGK